MIETKFKSKQTERQSKVRTSDVRASAIAALLGLGYPSDAQDWTGILQLLEKGYLHTQDLRRRRQ
jgi:hypothetical protein